MASADRPVEDFRREVRLSDPTPSDVGLEILRRMTPDQKARALQSLLETGWALAAAGIALRNPGLSPAAVHEATREAFRRGTP
ncbi:MAG: hypothetical protein WBC97_02765 [Gemmatimonadales bacterium]